MTSCPGPWVAHECGGGDEIHIAMAKGRNCIAMLFFDHREDASLLAAAPDLLRELQRLVKATEDWNADMEAIIGRVPGSGMYLDAAREAIAKATKEGN